MKDGKTVSKPLSVFLCYEGGQDNFERRALGSAAKGEAIKREKTAGEKGGKSSGG